MKNIALRHCACAPSDGARLLSRQAEAGTSLKKFLRLYNERRLCLCSSWFFRVFVVLSSEVVKYNRPHRYSFRQGIGSGKLSREDGSLRSNASSSRRNSVEYFRGRGSNKIPFGCYYFFEFANQRQMYRYSC